MSAPVAVAELAARLLEVLPRFTAAEQRVCLALYQLLAEGDPVRPERLAAVVNQPLRDIVELLAQPHIASLVYRDDTHHLVGFGGLSVRQTPHMLRLDDRTLYTWCAWDSLFLPAVLRTRGEVVSRCPETEITVRLTVTPTSVEQVTPPDAVMSFRMPDTSAFEGDAHATMASFCHFVHFFAAPPAASAWTARHTNTVVVSIAAAFALGRELNATRWGISDP